MTKFIFIVIYLTSSSGYQDAKVLKIVDLTREECNQAKELIKLGIEDKDKDLPIIKGCIQLLPTT